MEIRTEIEILRPPADVWRTLTDFAAYADWNPFIVSVAGRPEVGATLDVVVTPPGSRDLRFRPTVLVADVERELRWRGRFLVKGLLDGEHFFRLVPSGAGATRFVHGEDFSGLLVKPLTRQLANSARGFVFMNTALKKRLEAG